MKRLVLCTAAALLALAGSTRPAAASRYMVAWSRTTPAQQTEQTEQAAPSTERTKSGYMVCWNRSQTAE